ncbi:MAG: site-specific DNA-methyltransferase [Candidatus Hodarchaeales archaeon]
MRRDKQPVPPLLQTVETVSPVSIFSKLYQSYHKSTRKPISTPNITFDNRIAIRSYDHPNNWVNRIIYGDSLQAMSSLLHYEALGEQIQMIYFDPPFGINFDARFQPFEFTLAITPKIQTFHDNWADGLAGYLQFLRERLQIAKKLLNPQGSIFVQISDANVHHVRVLLDEIFGAHNFCSMITFRTGTSLQSQLIASVSDYLLWYAKDRTQCYSVPLFRERFWNEKVKTFDWIKLSDGHIRRLTSKERAGTVPPPPGSLFKATQLTRKLRQGEIPSPIRFEGREFLPPLGLYYPDYVDELVRQSRVIAVGSRLYGVRYESDFPFIRYTNLWNDTVRSTFASSKIYPVQTNPKVIERCLLMTTKPGDLVLDPTGGSGTTAYVAEKWGRRWIVCDISSISKLVTRQRLLTSPFDLYAINNPHSGVKNGFKYEQRQDKAGREVGGLVPHITRGTLSNKTPPKMEHLIDRPIRVLGTVRVPGPLVIQTLTQQQTKGADSFLSISNSNAKPGYLEEMISALQTVSSVQMGSHAISFHDIESLGNASLIHAVGKQNGKDSPVAFIFGSKHEVISPADIDAIMQSVSSKEFKRVFLIGFDFKAEAVNLLSNRNLSQDIPIIPVYASLDLHMASLQKHQRAHQLFEILSIPKVRLEEKEDLRENSNRYFQIEISGLFFIDPRTNSHLPLSTSKISAWFLDSDYDGSVFRVQQAFILQSKIWSQIKGRFKGKLPENAWKTLSKTKSQPFKAGKAKKVAIKTVDNRGNEVAVTKDIPARKQ